MGKHTRVILSQDQVAAAAVLVDVEGYRKPGTDFHYTVGRYTLPTLIRESVYIIGLYDEQGHGSSNFISGDEFREAKAKLTDYTQPFTAEELLEHRKYYAKKVKKNK